MKFIFSVLFLILTVFVSAQEFKSGTFLYRIIDEKNVEVLSSDKKMSGNVMIPESVAFDGKIYYVSQVADTGFANCKGIKSLILSSKISKIGKRAFFNCVNLNSVNIPYGVKEIPEGVFCHCQALGGVSLPDKITVIGDYAFAGCKDIVKINLPDMLKTIGNKAFYNCSKLVALRLPSEVEKIGIRAFQGCTGLLRFEVEEQNKFFTANESVLFSKDLKKLIKYPSKTETQLYTTPSSLTEIEEFAFENVNDIVAVQLSNGVQTISNYASVIARRFKR